MRQPILPVRQRPIDEQALSGLIGDGLDPELAKLYAARGVERLEQVTSQMRRLLPWTGLKGVEDFARVMADAIETQRKTVVVADYDSDGATSCAIAVAALRALGADIDFVVPNRFAHGYGLTPSVVELVHKEKAPEIIITVDNGISSYDGIELSRKLGIEVLVTDHHLPGPTIPKAACIVNPNQPGCAFPSKSMAGCGVIFYAVAALKDEMKRRGTLPAEFNLNAYLDFVAVGTIADVVKLDDNNRMLARLGLSRIRQGLAHPGVKALFTVARRSLGRATTKDIAFSVAPRINAAGRLDDMAIGIRCLLSEDFSEAMELALRLDELNGARKSIENEMQEDAWGDLLSQDEGGGFSRAVFRESFHEGVIGIVAGRIKEKAHRPTVVFAPAMEEGLLKGSGRSIPGFHLRDALDLVHKREPGLLVKFGGHAMAAGMTIVAGEFERFQGAFEKVCAEGLTPEMLERYALTDGDLPTRAMAIDMAELIESEIWGQGFPEPLFCSEFEILSQKVLKNAHLKLEVIKDGVKFDAIWFFRETPLASDRAKIVYSLATNEFNKNVTLQLMVAQAEEA